MTRGEVWWAKLPDPIGRLPVVLLSRNAAYAIRESITVAPVTRTIHDIPVEVPLGRQSRQCGHDTQTAARTPNYLAAAR